MKVKKRDRDNDRPHIKNGPNPLYIITGALILLIILFLLWQNHHISTTLNNGLELEQTDAGTIAVPGQPQQTDLPQSVAAPIRGIELQSPEVPLSTTQLIERSEEPNGNLLPQIVTEEDSPLQKPLQNEKLVSESTSPNPLPSICAASARTISNFYAHLDRQDNIKGYNLPTSSEKYFTHLLRNLLDNPPVVSGETNDLFTILQNTAHFFRILGKENIIILKAILHGEKDQFEYVLRDFYTIIHIPECTEKTFNLQVPEGALYEYAGFFLNSMGGRLYLFRRDSKSRIVVSYYAILLIDHSNRAGLNKHGIDIRPHITQLIEEIESTNNSLVLHDEYLDNLYNLQDYYQE